MTFFAVAATFLHAKITLYFNFEQEEFFLKAFHMYVNIYFGPLCQDDVRDGIGNPHF